MDKRYRKQVYLCLTKNPGECPLEEQNAKGSCMYRLSCEYGCVAHCLWEDKKSDKEDDEKKNAKVLIKHLEDSIASFDEELKERGEKRL